MAACPYIFDTNGLNMPWALTTVPYWQGTLEPLPNLSLHTLLKTQSFTVLLVLF